MSVTFITGNQNKANYLARLLDVTLDHQKVSLDEIQSVDLGEIAEHKVKQAYCIVQSPVLVEDVGLRFGALGQLPGPFIKFFVESHNGLDNLCRMLDSFSDRSAIAECVFAYYDGQNLKLFKGQVSGTIATIPAGDNGFGWDAIFIPDGHATTSAQLSEDDYDNVYRSIKPIEALRSFLHKNK